MDKIRDINNVDVPDGTLIMNGAHVTMVYRIEQLLKGLQQSSNLPWARAPKDWLPNPWYNQQRSVLEVRNDRVCFHHRSREEAKHKGKAC